MDAPGADSPLTGIILAGGKSTRFGADKASALLSGRPLLQWVVAALGGVCAELVVVTAPGQSLPAIDSPVPLRILADDVPALGPMGGLVTGMRVARTELCFGASCDSPLLRPALVYLLGAMADGFDAVCPAVGGRLQPLVSVYRTQTCLPVFGREVGAGNLKMTDALGHLRVRQVAEDDLRVADPALESFINANRREVLGQIEARLAARDG